MPRWIRLLPIALSALALSLGLAVSGASAKTHVKSCGSASIPSLGAGYIYGLGVTGTGCATGRKVEVAWQGCRLKHGLSGRCHSTVAGFRCSEQRQGIATNFTAKVSCHKSRARVSYSYEQALG